MRKLIRSAINFAQRSIVFGVTSMGLVFLFALSSDKGMIKGLPESCKKQRYTKSSQGDDVFHSPTEMDVSPTNFTRIDLRCEEIRLEKHLCLLP